MAKAKIGVLVSGGGTNLQAIIDSCKNGLLKDAAEIALVISNRRDAYALKRAADNKIESLFLGRKDFHDAVSYCESIANELKKRRVDLVCLAGFLLKLEPNFVRAFPNKILNIHPALLPKFGGKGMYGHFVHEAVIANRERESGATVHFVNEEYDSGPVIIQESIAVTPDYTPDILAMKVLEIEHKIYPQAILKVINNKA